MRKGSRPRLLSADIRSRIQKERFKTARFWLSLRDLVEHL